MNQQEHLRAGSMQLRKMRQLCERLFKLPSLPTVLSLKDPDGSAMPCSTAEGANLADLDVLVRPPSCLHRMPTLESMFSLPAIYTQKGKASRLWSQCGTAEHG